MSTEGRVYVVGGESGLVCVVGGESVHLDVALHDAFDSDACVRLCLRACLLAACVDVVKPLLAAAT